MAERWIECTPGSGIYRLSYDYRAFGEATSLAFRLESGRWAILSAPPKPPRETLAIFERDGVEALIAPNFGHLSGLSDWRGHHPDARFFAADRVLAETERLARVKPIPVSTLKPLNGIRVVEAPGTRCGSVWLRSTKGDTPVVYLDEVLITITERPRSWFSRLLFRLTNTKPGLGLNRLFLKTLCDNPDAHLEGALEFSEDASVICVAHGPSVTDRNDLARSREMLKSGLKRKN